MFSTLEKVEMCLQIGDSQMLLFQFLKGDFFLRKIVKKARRNYYFKLLTKSKENRISFLALSLVAFPVMILIENGYIADWDLDISSER